MKREYLTRFRTKAFWLSTALFPVMAFGFTILPGFIAARSAGAAEEIRIVDGTGQFFQLLEQTAEQMPEQRDQTQLTTEALGARDPEAARRELNERVEAGEFSGYLIVTEETLAEGNLVLYGRNPSTMVATEGLLVLLRQAVTKYRLLAMGMDADQADVAVRRVSMQVRQATNDPRREQSGVAALFMGLGLAMFMYFALIIYGIQVLQGVIEEKSSRIIEVILSSVRPFDLMMGKILGIGSLGLTQIAIWLLSASILTLPQIAAALTVTTRIAPPPVPTLVFFPIFFILGFFLFAAIYAGVGSMFNSIEDAQQVAGTVNMLLVAPLFFLLPVLKNPDGTLATVLSMVPVFSPVLMYLRIATQMPPMWQVVVSIVLLVLSILVTVWFVAKIYRIGILMYGKKPTLPEVWRWLRYS
jgi:ABC-2 type transport system permease protein